MKLGMRRISRLKSLTVLKISRVAFIPFFLRLQIEREIFKVHSSTIVIGGDEQPPVVSNARNFAIPVAQKTTLNWTVTGEDFNGTYNLYKDNLPVQAGNWSVNETLRFPFSELSLGVFNYTLVVSDSLNNSVEDTVIIQVIAPTKVPVLSSPDDVSYVQNATGNVINWNVSDYNGTYTILKDGVTNQTGNWNSSFTITLSVDGLELGNYNYTIVVKDLYDNELQDSVLVKVTLPPAPQPPDTSSITIFLLHYLSHR